MKYGYTVGIPCLRPGLLGLLFYHFYPQAHHPLRNLYCLQNRLEKGHRVKFHMNQDLRRFDTFQHLIINVKGLKLRSSKGFLPERTLRILYKSLLGRLTASTRNKQRSASS